MVYLTEVALRRQHRLHSSSKIESWEVFFTCGRCFISPFFHSPEKDDDVSIRHFPPSHAPAFEAGIIIKKKTYVKFVKNSFLELPYMDHHCRFCDRRIDVHR